MEYIRVTNENIDYLTNEQMNNKRFLKLLSK